MTDILATIDDTLLDDANGGLGFSFGGGLTFNDKPVVGGSVSASAGDGAAEVSGSLQVGKKKVSGGIGFGFF
ncbi:MAG: hypothetical protein QM778_31580 [Myxococcales bacterium]